MEFFLLSILITVFAGLMVLVIINKSKGLDAEVRMTAQILKNLIIKNDNLTRNIAGVKISLRAAKKTLEILVKAEHKKTRKETQEIKTRLTQVRKDLNAIEKAVGIKPKKRKA